MPRSTSRSSRSVGWTAATVGLLPATAGATWWLVGDRSTTSVDPSYLVRAPEIEPAVEIVVGALLTAYVAGFWWTFLRCTRRAGTTGAWLAVPACVTVAGLVVGASGRVVTAGVIGANIGGGFALLFGPTTVLVLLGLATARAVVLLRRGRVTSGA